MKEEQEAQKKAEEKARRDAIYQQYLDRKAADSEGAGEGDAGPSGAPGGVTRRVKAKGAQKAPRPKSQPPGGYPPGPGGDVRDGASVAAASNRGKSPGPDSMKCE